MRHFPSLAAILVLACVLIACQSTATAPTATPLQSPLASPLQRAALTPAAVPSLTIPAPARNRGVVVGSISVLSTEQPMAGIEIFLGDHIGDSEGVPLFGLDVNNAPRATTDEYGRFVFESVPPGSYVLIIWTPVNSVMVREPETEIPLQLEVQAGQVVNLGPLAEVLP